MRSKAWVCGRSLTGISGSNSAYRIDIYCDCCVLSSRKRTLRRPDHLSRGVSPISVYPMNVIQKPLRGGLDPESGRRASGEERGGELFIILGWQII